MSRRRQKPGAFKPYGCRGARRSAKYTANAIQIKSASRPLSGRRTNRANAATSASNFTPLKSAAPGNGLEAVRAKLHESENVKVKVGRPPARCLEIDLLRSFLQLP